jgi:peroxiredoxin|tara:strand:- start:2436 stop:3089 length:654 start_codon:yes stop_codon:yes gene_type:complete
MGFESFAEHLAEINRITCDQLPTPQIAVLRRAVASLRKSGIVERCLQPGETSPDFNFINAANEQSSLYALLADGPTVINFFRGFWCNFCRTELEAYEKVLPQFEALGAHYLAVSPFEQMPVQDQPENCQMMCDCDNQIGHAFGIVYELQEEEKSLFTEWGIHLDEVNQCRKWELPLPATYLIGQDHVVEFQYVDADFRKRLSPEELIEALTRFQSRL